ncbi:DUF4129 domain-containing protein [Chloroflexota bacterium]
MKTEWHRWILYATTMGIEGCWLYALMVLLNHKAADGRLSVFGMLLSYLLAFGLNSFLCRLRWPAFCRRIISWLAWAAAVLLTVKIQLLGGLAFSDTAWLLAIPRAFAGIFEGFQPELLILISTTVIWWLGRRLAYLKINFTIQLSEFQFGLFILVFLYFISSLLEVEITHSVYLIVVFFLFSLLGISIAHALEGTSWLSGLYQGHWSGVLLVSISLVLILGFLISLVVTPDFLQLFLAVLKWLWELFMSIMGFLASLMPTSEMAEPPPAPAMPAMEDVDSFELFTMPETLRTVLRIGWVVLMIGVTLVALWRISSEIFSWLRRKMAGMTGADFEPLPGAFRADLLGLLKRIISWLLGLKRLFHPRTRAEPTLPEIATVRQIYRQLLRWAAKAGFPRHICQTPHEYLYDLTGRLPEAREDLDLVTQQYVRTRYGATLLTESELHQLRQSWYNIKQYHL